MSSESTAGRTPRNGLEASPAQKTRGVDSDTGRCACGRELAGYDAARDLAVCEACATADALRLDVQEAHASGVGVSYTVTAPENPHKTATVVVLPDGQAWGLVADRRKHGDRFVDAARRAVVEHGCAEVAPDV